MGRRDRTLDRKQERKPSPPVPATALPATRAFTAETTDDKVAPKSESHQAFRFSQIAISEGHLTTPTDAPTSLQPKLTLGQPGDKYEQEADAVAQQVVQRLNTPLAGSPQTHHPDEELQRQLWQGQPLQRDSSIPVGPVDPQFEQRLDRARGSGSTMAPVVQTQMESAMGADFGRVKIHTDAHADQLSRSIQAKAFTTGNDVFFKQGAYAPTSRSGQELLAHELTHVVQQSGGVQRQIQRKQLTKLDKKNVGTQLVGTTITQDIQAGIETYNKIESGRNYDEKLKVLGKVLGHTKKWLERYENSEDTKKQGKITAIKGIQLEANSEQQQVKQARQQATDTAIDGKNQSRQQQDPKFEELETQVFKDIYDPIVKSINAQVLLKLGVGRGEWRRSKDLNEFRQNLKDTARDQAKQDIDQDTGNQLSNETESMKNFIKMKHTHIAMSVVYVRELSSIMNTWLLHRRD